VTSTNGRPRICVIKADGTNCEVETAFAIEKAGGRAEVVPINLLRRGDVRLSDFDALVVPGGFSYGDDVASGKVLAVELMTFLADELRRFAELGKPVLGVCNGFQVLVRTGLLPFGELGEMRATLAQNERGRFECRWVRMAPEGEAPLLAGLPETVELPVAHGEGRFYADDETLRRIEDAGLVALRYLDEEGRPTADYPANPAGSLHAIAGVTDPSGRILGLMPHPERFVERFHHPDWRRRPPDEEPHGMAFFRRLVELARGS
jgi:phosphoribosylformylglycinamidine synthase